MKRVLLAILLFPLTRMVIALFAIVLFTGLESQAMALLGIRLGVAEREWFVVLSGATTSLTACLAYVAYVRVFERRWAVELSLKKALVDLAAGAGITVGLISATVGCLWLGGFYHVDGIGRLPSAPILVEMGLFAGFFEEIVSRAVVFRITEESLGTWLAIAISGLLFGFAHIFNPNASWIAAVSIAIEAGILLAAGYIITRRLWLPIGMHFAWNVTLGGVYGVPVSGLPVEGLLKGRLTGPDILSGGPFGPEDSIFTVIICTSLAIFFLVHAERQGWIIRPFWRRKPEPFPDDAWIDQLAESHPDGTSGWGPDAIAESHLDEIAESGPDAHASSPT
jgi:uncharacterized protein